jgi:phosphopantothenoylcysteine decarboxylase/phosphopantothenate--cysteine ligase
VGDFRAASPSGEKLHRANGEFQVALTANPDILASMARKRKRSQTLIGFGLETDDAVGAGKKKLEAKGVDLLVVNNPNDKGAAIGGDTNVVTLLEPRREPRRLPVLPKREVAKRVFDWVVKRRSSPSRRQSLERSAP